MRTTADADTDTSATASGTKAGSPKVSPSKFDQQLLSNFGQKANSPKVNVRGLPGISPPRCAKSEGIRSSNTSPEQAKSALSSTIQRERTLESLQEGAQRKREKIAELRRKRNQVKVDDKQESLNEGDSDISRRSSATSPLTIASNANADTPVPRAVLQAHNARQSIGKLASPTGEKFFNDIELNLLLQPIELDEQVDGLLSPPPRAPKQQHQQQQVDSNDPVQRINCGDRQMQRASTIATNTVATAANTGNFSDFLNAGDYNDREDFRIDIPSTSLSPMLPIGWGRGDMTMPRGSARMRRRSRTVALVPENNDNRNSAGDAAVAGKADPFTATPTAGNQPQGAASAADGAKGVDDQAQTTDLLIEAEMARNLELRRELARLHGTAKALTKLVIASRRTNEAVANNRAHLYSKKT